MNVVCVSYSRGTQYLVQSIPRTISVITVILVVFLTFLWFQMFWSARLLYLSFAICIAPPLMFVPMKFTWTGTAVFPVIIPYGMTPFACVSITEIALEFMPAWNVFNCPVIIMPKRTEKSSLPVVLTTKRGGSRITCVL